MITKKEVYSGNCRLKNVAEMFNRPKSAYLYYHIFFKK